MLDAAGLTAQRTGAVGAVGLKHTTPPDIHSIGIIGVGVQGVWQTIFACAVRRLHTVFFIARSDKKAQHFIAAVSARVAPMRFHRCASIDDLLRRTAVIITATTSSTPVLPNDTASLQNKHFVSVGSFKPSMQELPNAAYSLAQNVVVDSDAAKTEVGDLIGPLSLGLIHDSHIVHLAHVVSGKRSLDLTRTTVVKSVGMAIYDLYAAQAFIAEAQRLGRGTPLE